MKLTITHQDSYSRGQLLLRTLLGWLYIGIPNGFLMFFVGIWAGILGFVAFWIVLFTGKYPENFFLFQIKFINWSLRLSAAMTHLVDGTPAIGINGTSEKVFLEVERPEKINQLLVLVRIIFGIFYVAIPHGFCLFFRAIGAGVLMFLSWWAILITGKYPEKWHAFAVGTSRWTSRLQLYMGFFTDTYPPFSGKE